MILSRNIGPSTIPALLTLARSLPSLVISGHATGYQWPETSALSTKRHPIYIPQLCSAVCSV